MSTDKQKADTPPPQLLGTGAARAAATALKSRAQRLEEAEKKDTGYAAGGSIRANSREYDTISPAGRNVHEGRGYAKGGLVATQSRGFGKARRG